MGTFQATAKDIRTTIGYVVRSLSEMADNENKMFVRSYEPIRDTAWEGCSDSTKKMIEEEYLQKKDAHEKLMAELKTKIQGISEAMSQNFLDAAKEMIIEQGLVETVYTGLTRLSATIEANRTSKNKASLDDLDMQAVLDRFDSFRQGADDYVDVYKWLCIVAVNKWLMGEIVVGDDENEQELPKDDKLTREQEQTVRKILKKAIERVGMDYENDLELNNKRKKNNDELRNTYLSQKITDTSIIERIEQQHQTVNEQLNEIHESLEISIRNWKFFSEILIPTLINEQLSSAELLLDRGVTKELRRGLRLLQIDFKKRREDKPNIEEPEHIKKIIQDYKEYRLNESEYQEIMYWLDIAETDKWLEKIEPALAINDKNDIGNNLQVFDFYDEIEEQEYFKKCRDEAFNNLVDDIKEKLNTPEISFPKASSELIDFINKHKRKATEHLVRKLMWWFFEKDSTDKYGCICNGIGTHEELTEFHIMYNEFTRTYLTQFALTINTEKFIKTLHNEPPETAIIILEGLLKHHEKKDLHETYFGVLDYNADWRHYMIEILRKEIKFHELRIALEKNESKTTPNIDTEKRSNGVSENAHGNAIAATNGQVDTTLDAAKKPGRKEKLSMDVFKKEIYPDMKKMFPDSKHVAGKKAYCTQIGKKYGVSEKTIRDKFDKCNLGE